MPGENNGQALFHKAERRRSFIKLAITGPSGSGKTYSALLLAQGLGGKIAMIDTESGSGEMYSSLGDYDALQIDAPFTIQKYVAAIRGAQSAGYDMLIIDSLTHAWAGEGGLLAQKESLDARGGNSYTNWATITKQHEQFKATLLQTPIHIIATMRSKQDYILQSNSKGKQAPVKVGLAPIQREGMEYEFTTVFDIAMNHEAEVSKDRTGLFDGIVGKLSIEHGQQIAAWLADATAEALPPSNGDAPTNGTDLQPPQPASPIPLGAMITVMVGRGKTAEGNNDPVYIWQAAWKDPAGKAHNFVLWCWDLQAAKAATLADDPATFQGYVAVTLSRRKQSKPNHYTAETMELGVGPVIDMDAAQTE